MNMYSIMNDMELLTLLRQDNEEAFSEIYNRHWKSLFYTAYNIIQIKEVAQDAVQEVFIALWQRRKKVEIEYLKMYMQQAVRFQILKAIRDQKTEERFYNRLASITAEIVYENPLLLKEQETLLKRIMESLPEDCRHIFKLNREERLTYKQIAIQLGISEKTVEKKMSACLKHIREGLQRDLIFLVFLAFYSIGG